MYQCNTLKMPFWATLTVFKQTKLTLKNHKVYKLYHEIKYKNKQA